MANRQAPDPSGIGLKRAYDPVEPGDGRRVLVDRLWPRGVTKQAARIDQWMRDVAPSGDVRRRFGHDPAHWEEFRRHYGQELAEPNRRVLIAELVEHARRGPLTLVYAARDPAHNNAVVLREALLAALTGRDT